MAHWKKRLCMKIEDELEEMAERERLSTGEFELLHKLVDTWSNLKTQKAMDEYLDEWDEEEESGMYYSRVMPSHRGEGSYRRGRDSMGRYTSRDRSEKDSLRAQLHDLSRRIEEM